MPDLPSPTPPAFIHKRDGRLVPFEPDKICCALFAATETLGCPDAFLAREMTDGVVHFLSAELDKAVPSTVQVAESVAKVVRELGQPALAHAFVAGRTRKTATRESGVSDAPETVVRIAPGTDLPSLLRTCARDFTMRRVFARDLAAAQADRLITLTGLETPFELAGCTVAPPRVRGWTEALIEARNRAGLVVAVDGPEFVLAEATTEDAAARLAHELELGHRATKLGVVVNLNVAQPPAWADDLGLGPLFLEQRRPAEPHRLARLADALLLSLLPGAEGIPRWEETSYQSVGRADTAERPCDPRSTVVPGSPFPPFTVRVDWHLRDRDFLAENKDRLLRVARLAQSGAAVTVVFDRPRRAMQLAEGMDRCNPALLMVVGLNLPRLLDQPGVCQNVPLLLQKVSSLARMALSAGVQKRDFLRRNDEGRRALTRGFLIERACLVVVPIGLERTVRRLTGEGLCGRGLDLGRRIVERLTEVLERDGMACQLSARLDSPPGPLESIAEDLGVTTWDATASVKGQLRAAGELHAVARGGTAVVHTPGDEPSTAEQVADWLDWAWRHTDVNRLRWFFTAPATRQLVLNLKGQPIG